MRSGPSSKSDATRKRSTPRGELSRVSSIARRELGCPLPMILNMWKSQPEEGVSARTLYRNNRQPFSECSTRRRGLRDVDNCTSVQKCKNKYALRLKRNANSTAAGVKLWEQERGTTLENPPHETEAEETKT